MHASQKSGFMKFYFSTSGEEQEGKMQCCLHCKFSLFKCMQLANQLRALLWKSVTKLVVNLTFVRHVLKVLLIVFQKNVFRCKNHHFLYKLFVFHCNQSLKQIKCQKIWCYCIFQQPDIWEAYLKNVHFSMKNFSPRNWNYYKFPLWEGH